MSRPVMTIGATALALVLGIIIGGQWPTGPAGSTGQRAESVAPQGSVTAGPFRVAAAVNPEVPAVGDNNVTLVVTDAAGAPVEGAQISTTAIMRAMGQMPEMRVPADMTETRPGRYEGNLSLSMDGSWPLTVEIDKPGLGNTTVVFGMATRRSGLELLSGGQGPAGSAANQPDAALPAGMFSVDARRRQAIGLKLGEVATTRMRRQVRAVGRVTYDQTRLSDVSLRFDAWVGELYADHVGIVVNRGDALFTVYGPDLLAAQQEYLQVVQRSGSGSLAAAARKRLELWNLTESAIAALRERGVPLDYVPIVAPRSGVVVSKHVVEGTAQRAGATLMRIADLSEVWVEAQVYEADLATLSTGMPVTVTLPFLPGASYAGQVDYIYPFLDAESRTARVRVPLQNRDGALKPDMYAEVMLEVDLGERLVVPAEAVIFAGQTRVVFEDLGDGRLAPRRIQTGQRNGDSIEVLAGLEPGARVVTSGAFLIASESRLRSGLDQW